MTPPIFSQESGVCVGVVLAAKRASSLFLSPKDPKRKHPEPGNLNPKQTKPKLLFLKRSGVRTMAEGLKADNTSRCGWVTWQVGHPATPVM